MRSRIVTNTLYSIANRPLFVIHHNIKSYGNQNHRTNHSSLRKQRDKSRVRLMRRERRYLRAWDAADPFEFRNTLIQTRRSRPGKSVAIENHLQSIAWFCRNLNRGLKLRSTPKKEFPQRKI